MLAKQNRFSGAKDIRRLYKTAQSVRTRNFALRYHHGRPDGWRVAVVVSKKVHKSAVVRNRIRRRVYEIIRTDVSSALSGDYLVTVFHASLAVVSHKELQHELRNLFAKTGRS